MDAFEKVWKKINESYDELSKLPKPKQERIGGTYYGGTQLFSSVGNHLDLIEGEPYTEYYYGGRTNYSQLWGIRVGGAYKTEIPSELMAYICSIKDEVFSDGCAIIDDHGTNFSVYGIAKR